MRRFVYAISSLLLVTVIVLGCLWVASAEESDPLIFFASATPVPIKDVLGKADDSDSAVLLDYGESVVNNKKYLIIEGELDRSDSFESVKQLAEFIIRNSVHGAGEWRSLGENVELLFHSPEPMVLSCGKISLFFQDLLVEHMNVGKNRIRYVSMFNSSGLDPASVTKGYLKGGHAVLEIFFPELRKWVVFDLDKGVIPSVGDRPLSMIEMQALEEDEIMLEPLGRDENRKGQKSQKAVNKYYKSARKYFGIKTGKRYVFLYSGKPGLADTFRQNFEKANGRKAEIVTDRDTYKNRFYADQI